MNVTFRQLQVFECVARLLSFTRAAEELHMTQPAVSMQVKQLESSVGLELYEQIGKKIYLTEAGTEMQHYSRSIAGLIKEADDVMDTLKGAEYGHLTISVASTANYFATRLLASFCKKHSHVTFSLDVTNRESLLNQLDANEPNMVIMGQPPENMDLVTQAIMSNPLVIIAHPRHPLVKKKNIPIELIKNETFVVREKGSGTRIAMQRFFIKQGMKLKTGMELNSNEAIKQAVQADMGLGIVSIHTLELELEAKRLAVLNVKAFPIRRTWYLVYPQGKRLSPVAKAFQQYVLTEAKKTLKLPL